MITITIAFLQTGLHQKKRLGIGNLYSKYFADETYNAHRAVDDIAAMERLFTSTPLVSFFINSNYMQYAKINTGME